MKNGQHKTKTLMGEVCLFVKNKEKRIKIDKKQMKFE